METTWKKHIRKTGSVGGLESHPPTQTRTTSRHPPPMMRRSTARAHCHGATATHCTRSPPRRNRRSSGGSRKPLGVRTAQEGVVLGATALIKGAGAALGACRPARVAVEGGAFTPAPTGVRVRRSRRGRGAPVVAATFCFFVRTLCAKAS